MHPFPHRYDVRSVATPSAPISHPGERLPTLLGDAPVEFGGPGDQWSPEELLTAAVADCFILSFRAVARASGFDWTSLSCDVEGTLDKVDRFPVFTRFLLRVVLEVPPGTDTDRAHRLVEKAERICLVSNSLTAERELHAEIKVEAMA